MLQSAVDSLDSFRKALDSIKQEIGYGRIINALARINQNIKDVSDPALKAEFSYYKILCLYQQKAPSYSSFLCEAESFIGNLDLFRYLDCHSQNRIYLMYGNVLIEQKKFFEGILQLQNVTHESKLLYFKAKLNIAEVILKTTPHEQAQIVDTLTPLDIPELNQSYRLLALHKWLILAKVTKNREYVERAVARLCEQTTSDNYALDHKLFVLAEYLNQSLIFAFSTEMVDQVEKLLHNHIALLPVEEFFSKSCYLGVLQNYQIQRQPPIGVDLDRLTHRSSSPILTSSSSSSASSSSTWSPSGRKSPDLVTSDSYSPDLQDKTELVHR